MLHLFVFFLYFVKCGWMWKRIGKLNGVSETHWRDRAIKWNGNISADCSNMKQDNVISFLHNFWQLKRLQTKWFLIFDTRTVHFSIDSWHPQFAWNSYYFFSCYLFFFCLPFAKLYCERIVCYKHKHIDTSIWCVCLCAYLPLVLLYAWYRYGSISKRDRTFC